MEAVLEQPKASFLSRFQDTHKSVSDEIEKKYESTILQILKNYADEKGVEYDHTIDNVDVFRKQVIAKMPKAQQEQIGDFEKNVRTQLTSVTDALKDGSQNAFSKFGEKFLGVGKTSLKLIAKSTAIRVATMLNPTLAGAGVAATIIVPTVVNSVEKYKEQKKERSSTALNTMLVMLCVKKDADDKISFDLPPEAMEKVQKNLAKKGINVEADNEVKFMADIIGLDDEKKEQALNIINETKFLETGEKLNIDEEKKKLVNRYELIKEGSKKVVSMISAGVLIGSNIGNTLNDLAGDEAASLITGLTTGGITGNAAAAIGVGGAQYAISKFGHYIPVVGNVLEDITKKVNTHINIGAAVGVSTAATLLFQVLPYTIKGTINWIKSKKKPPAVPTVPSEKGDDEKGTDEQAQGKDGGDFSSRLEHAQGVTDECLKRKNPREIALEITADALRTKGINIPKGTYSNEQLKEYTKSLNKEDKEEILEVARTLEEANKLKETGFKHIVKNIAKTAYWGGIIALLGLGAYDKFINPGFIQALHDKQELRKLMDKRREEIAAEQGVDKNTISDEAVVQSLEGSTKQDQSQVAEELRKYFPKKTSDYDSIIDIDIYRNVNLMDLSTEARAVTGMKSMGILPKNFDPTKISITSMDDLSKLDIDTEKLSTVLEKYISGMDDPNKLMRAIRAFYGSEVSATDWTNAAEVAKALANSDMAKRYIVIQSGVDLPVGLINTMYENTDVDLDVFTNAFNSGIGQLISGMPTQSSSPEEILAYMTKLNEGNGFEKEVFNNYLDNTGKKGSFWDQFNLFSNPSKEVTELSENAQQLKTMLDNLGHPEVINSDIITNAHEYAALGAALGAVFGVVKEGSGKKGFVAKAIDKIKGLFGKKQKALPPAEPEKGDSEENAFVESLKDDGNESRSVDKEEHDDNEPKEEKGKGDGEDLDR